MTVTASALDWLLDSDEPGIVFQAKRDLLGEADPPEAAHVLEGPKVRALLAGQQPDGGFGVNVYAKWGGAHWRLVSLVELGVPAGEPRCVAAAETVLAWLTGEGHRSRIPTIDGLVRRCGSQEGNALAVCCRLGLADDPRVRLLAESLVEWQWPDGGWNCDKNATGYRSSFNESLPPMWGLHEYSVATGETAAKDAAERTAELLLEHRLFRTLATGEPIRPSFVVMHQPPFWHYDFFRALVVLAQDGPGRRPAGCRRAGAVGGAPARRRTLAPRRALVEAARVEGKQHRGRRLGLRPERPADPGRPSRPCSRLELIPVSPLVMRNAPAPTRELQVRQDVPITVSPGPP